MAKKNKRPGKRIDAQATPLSHNPFASLAAPSTESPVRVEAKPAAPTEQPSSFLPKVVVRREKKGRGGKTVTRVTGVVSPDAVLKEMKRSLGCGATLEAEDIVLLGDVGDRAAAWLEEAGAKVVRGS